MNTYETTSLLEPLPRIDRDVARAAATLSPTEARYLVDLYYTWQEDRKRAGNQVRSMETEPHSAIAWLFDTAETVETRIKSMLGAYAEAHIAGQWALSIHGIGPVIAAGLLAHIDIARAPTVGHIWRYAGLDPTVTWHKGEKRPWNASLKILCWKIGESFVKVSNSDADYYGHVYAERKLFEQARNESGALADQAAAKLAQYRIGKDTDAYAAYSVGKLPPAHIHARAKRYAVKLLLSHFHHVLWESTYGAPPVRPYILNQPGHVHFLAPPNWPLGK